MAAARRDLEAYYVRAMLEIRPTLHLAERMAVRTDQLLFRSGAASPGAGWRSHVLPAFVVLDLVVWLVLRHSDRFGLWWRLPLDAADAAFWATSPLPRSGDYGTAIMIAIPLAVEAGVRLGWRGLAVPATLALVTWPVAATVGKPPHFIALGWLAMGVGVGAGFYRHCRRLDERSERARQRARAAARRRAYLAGQNQVAMGASSAVDAIEGLVPVLGRPRAGSALWQLADGWKRNLSTSTAEEASYLQVVLLEWERFHNSHPDLSGLVRVRVPEGEGTTLLSADQARRLHRQLEARNLRGLVDVRLAEPGAPRLPGQALGLVVDGRAVAVPADPRPDLPPFDPTAVAYAYIFLLVIVGLVPAVAGTRLPAVVAGDALCAVAGVYSHRRILALGERAAPRVFAVAVAVGTALTVLLSFAAMLVSRDGEPIPSYGAPLLLLSFIAGFHWKSLARPALVVPAATALIVVLGVVVFPAPSALYARAIVATMAASIYPFFACRHLARALEGATQRHAASTHATDEGADRAAFVEGRESVVGLVRQARDDALRQLRALEPELDGHVAELASARLEEVERRLQTIDGGGTSHLPDR